jgi:hypothetical protein
MPTFKLSKADRKKIEMAAELTEEPASVHEATVVRPWKCRATTVRVPFAGRQRGGRQ